MVLIKEKKYFDSTLIHLEKNFQAQAKYIIKLIINWISPKLNLSQISNSQIDIF
jgi:hypothetical protein